MYNFFVLGQIPGTAIVVSFWMWIELAALCGVTLLWTSYRRRQYMHDYLQPTVITAH